ncbi:snake venom 5'-nucleotidase-like [Asterias amurensis]|uniref:snake venom 5'-nucleotidase-like n=1 Tax=Asterias amurensis TaxID=7602 RepID=UPI003AB6CFE4
MFLDARVLVVLLPAACLATFDLTVLHTNDVHARFEQFTDKGGNCKDEDSMDGECYGGVARRVTKVREIRAQEDNVILLDGGDQFQGTMWFYLYKGRATSHFMNAIGYDVMAIGNHEFDNGPAGLEQFLRDVNASVVSCNIDASKEPSINGLFTKSTVLTIGGEKIGVVGYTLTQTPEISTTKELVFSDEIPAIQAEVDRLIVEENINKIIALGHAGHTMDKKIAKEVQGVDIVVGGHSNTFLYNGTQPDSDKPIGVYPTVEHPDSDTSGNVLVVQDYTFGKYLGRLHVTFDDSGKITSWEGNPILLDNNVEEDPGTLEEIKEWGEEVGNVSREYIGRTNVVLKSDCRTNECNLGNMLTDAYVSYGTHDLVNGTRQNDVTIAIINGGSIRTRLSAGDITVGDITTVIPFGNTVDTITIKGMFILEALEHSVAKYSDVEPGGEFLQVSGLLVTYDLSKSPGSRVVKVEVRCSICEVPDFAPLDPNKEYKVLMNNFLAEIGGDGYNMLRYNHTERISGNLDIMVATEYIKRLTPLTTGLERRITFVENDDNPCGDGSTSGGRHETGVSAMFFSILIFAFYLTL